MYRHLLYKDKTDLLWSLWFWHKHTHDQNPFTRTTTTAGNVQDVCKWMTFHYYFVMSRRKEKRCVPFPCLPSDKYLFNLPVFCTFEGGAGWRPRWSKSVPSWVSRRPCSSSAGTWTRSRLGSARSCKLQQTNPTKTPPTSRYTLPSASTGPVARRSPHAADLNQCTVSLQRNSAHEFN